MDNNLKSYTFFELFRDSHSLLFKNIGHTIRLMLIIFLSFFVYAIVLSLLFAALFPVQDSLDFFKDQSNLQNPYAILQFFSSYGSSIIIFFAVFFIASLVISIFNNFLSIIIMNDIFISYYNNSNWTFFSSIKKNIKYLFKFIGLSIVYSVFIFGIYIVMALFNLFKTDSFLFFLVSVVFAFCTYFVLILFYLSSISIQSEGTGVFQSITRSIELIKYSFFRVMAYSFLFFSFFTFFIFMALLIMVALSTFVSNFFLFPLFILFLIIFFYLYPIIASFFVTIFFKQKSMFEDNNRSEGENIQTFDDITHS